MFWAFFEQAGGSINLFTERNVTRDIGGWTMPTSWGQAFNPFFILVFGIAFTILWKRLADAGREPSTPVKFALGIFQLGLGFVVLGFGARLNYETGYVNILWVVLGYLLHTTGELCLSPVGLSAVTKLAVPSVVGVMMGTWFLASAYSSYVAAQIATIAARPATEATLDRAGALAGYTELFGQLLTIGLAGGAVLIVLSPILKRLMHGVR